MKPSRARKYLVIVEAKKGFVSLMNTYREAERTVELCKELDTWCTVVEYNTGTVFLRNIPTKED